MRLQIFLALTLIACTSPKSKIGEHNSVSNNSLEFKISNGQIGFLKTGEPLDLALKKLHDFKIVKDSIPTCEGCNTFSPLYVISDKDFRDLFVFEPGWDSTNRNKLFRIITGDSRFITDKGIRVGMTVKDLKEKYEISSVDTGGETGVHILVKDFHGSFGVELPQIQNWWDFNKETIPDTLKIESIVIL